MYRQGGEACRAGRRHGGFTEDEVFGSGYSGGQQSRGCDGASSWHQGIDSRREVVLVVAGLLRSKHGTHCAAKGTSVAGRGYLRFDQELASDPRSRRSTSSRCYGAGRFLWRRLFRPRGTPFSGCWPCGRGCSSRPGTGYKGSLFCPSPRRYSLRKGASGSRSDGGAGMDLRCGPWCS
jgi:hypothetical protein